MISIILAYAADDFQNSRIKRRTYDTLGDICPIFERPELCFKSAVTILVW